LFTSEEWTALQRTFNGVPAPPRADHCAAPLAGLMKCGECGCSITSKPGVFRVPLCTLKLLL
jgi:hypothetical protein